MIPTLLAWVSSYPRPWATPVVRNRTKRRLREIMRPRLGELRAGELFVLRALPHAADAEFSVLEAEVDQLLAKAQKKLEHRGRRA